MKEPNPGAISFEMQHIQAPVYTQIQTAAMSIGLDRDIPKTTRQHDCNQIDQIQNRLRLIGMLLATLPPNAGATPGVALGFLV